MRRIVFYFLLFALILFSQNALGDEQGIGEEGKDTGFDPETFDYENGDYSLITDWAVIDWGKIPYERIKDVPAEKLAYSSLTTDQRHAMTVDQIALNFESINNFFDVNTFHAEQAIEETYGISGRVHITGDANIRSGVLSGLTGKRHSVPLNALSENVDILLRSDGSIQIEGSTTIPQDGKAIYSYTNERLVDMHDRQLSMHGTLFADHGQISIIDGDLTVDKIKLQALPDGENALPVYFDGKNHDGTFVAIDLVHYSLQASISQKDTYEMSISFQPGNSLIDVDPEDNLHIDFSYGTLTVTRREGMIPTVDMTTDEFSITNGREKYSWTFEEFRQDSYDETLENGHTPLALSFDIFDPTTNKVMNDHKIIFDNSGNFIVAPTDYPLYHLECTSCAENFEDNEEAFRVIQERFSLVKGVTIHSPTVGHDINTMQRIYSHLSALSPKLRSSISEVIVMQPDEIKKICMFNAGACAAPGTVIVPEDVDFHLFKHEAAHAYTARLFAREHIQGDGQFLVYQLELARKYDLNHPLVPAQAEGCNDPSCFYGFHSEHDIMRGVYSSQDIIRLPDDEVQEWFRLQQEMKHKETFEERWKKTAGEVYGTDLEDTPGLFDLPKRWKDGNSDPKNGCVTPYGCRNWLEDISEFVERGSGFFENEHLIQPPGHPEHDPAKYDPRYKQKLDLLVEYGFITRDDYNKILETPTVRYQQQPVEQ